MTLLYEDPRSRVTAYRTPGRRDDDDDIIHRRLSRAHRRETVRVSLGDITIDIESSPITPRVQVTSATDDNPRLSLGMGGRGITRGEVPSTRGSSPIKFKSESSRDEEMPDIPLQHEEEQESDDDVPDIITGEELARLRALEKKQKKEPPKESSSEEDDGWADQDDDDESVDEMETNLEGITIQGQGSSQNPQDQGAFGPDTQAIFEENEDLTLPNLEITPSPEKPRVNGGISRDDDVLNPVREMNAWAEKQAKTFKVSKEIVWWMLERTGAKKKLAVAALEKFVKDGSNVPPIHCSCTLRYGFLALVFFRC